MIIEEWETTSFEEIVELYHDAKWSAYTKDIDSLKKALYQSLKLFVARCDGTIVGVIRVVGDGISMIYIQDIIVHSQFQRKGIGTKLLQHVLKEYSHVRQTILLTELHEETMQFYESVGFHKERDYNCVAYLKFQNI